MTISWMKIQASCLILWNLTNSCISLAMSWWSCMLAILSSLLSPFALMWTLTISCCDFLSGWTKKDCLPDFNCDVWVIFIRSALTLYSQSETVIIYELCLFNITKLFSSQKQSWRESTCINRIKRKNHGCCHCLEFLKSGTVTWINWAVVSSSKLT